MSYLNGEHYSVRRFRDQSASWLKELIAERVGQIEFRSFESAYEELYGKMPVESEQMVQPCPKLDIHTHTPRAIREFSNFIQTEFSNDEILGVYAHGSIGNEDFIEGSSDFDAMVIVRKETLRDDKQLKEVQRKLVAANTYLYLFDPLQHHNLCVLSELDLMYYFEPVFPMVLFEYAKEVTTFGNELCFRCLNASAYTKNLLKRWEDAFSPEKRNQFNLNTSYGIKHAIQSVLFIPLIYQQAKTGTYRFKKFVYDEVCHDFSPEIWSVVERATDIRKTCHYSSLYPYAFRNFIGSIHYKYLAQLHRKLDRNNSAEIMNIMGDDFMDRAWSLAKQMNQLLGVTP